MTNENLEDEGTGSAVVEVALIHLNTSTETRKEV